MPEQPAFFSHLLTHNIWFEAEPVRLLWLTIFSQADRDGKLIVAERFLVRASNLSPEQTAKAFQTLQQKRYIRVRQETIELPDYAYWRQLLVQDANRDYWRNRKAAERSRKSPK